LRPLLKFVKKESIMKSIKKIDIHAHVSPFPDWAPKAPSGYPMVSADKLISFYDDLNIEYGMLLPITSPECQYFEMMTSETCKYISEQHPDRFMWFCGIDPRACGHKPTADFSRLLEHYKSLGAKGVGELTCQLYTDDPLVDNLFAQCAEAGMPVTIHIAPKHGDYYGIIDEVGLPRLEKILKKHKDLIVFGHSQPFWAEISTDASDDNRVGYPEGKVTEGRLSHLLREYPNLYCDLSATSGANALMRDPDYAARFIEEFSDRLLYGCDICSEKNIHMYKFEDFLNGMLSDGSISEENYRKLVRGNAIRVLGLYMR